MKKHIKTLLLIVIAFVVLLLVQSYNSFEKSEKVLIFIETDKEIIKPKEWLIVTLYLKNNSNKKHYFFGPYSEDVINSCFDSTKRKIHTTFIEDIGERYKVIIPKGYYSLNPQEEKVFTYKFFLEKANDETWGYGCYLNDFNSNEKLVLGLKKSFTIKMHYKIKHSYIEEGKKYGLKNIYNGTIRSNEVVIKVD